MRGVCRPEPKSLAIGTSLNARRFSALPEIPGDFFQFGREVLVGQNRISGDPEKFLAGAKVPGGIYQFECEARFGRNQNPWQYLLM